MRTYSELITIPTFEERFEYLKLDGTIGEETFGYDRYFNQKLYHSKEWQSVRRQVIIRDNGCDLAIPDREIFDCILVHHMNPITLDDIETHNPDIFNPEYLITTFRMTHNAIHYGDESLLISSEPIIRTPNDTCPWRSENG